MQFGVAQGEGLPGGFGVLTAAAMGCAGIAAAPCSCGLA